MCNRCNDTFLPDFFGNKLFGPSEEKRKRYEYFFNCTHENKKPFTVHWIKEVNHGSGLPPSQQLTKHAYENMACEECLKRYDRCWDCDICIQKYEQGIMDKKD